MAKSKAKKEARFINPPNKLKAKVGSGGIDPKLLEKAQEQIENNDTDYESFAIGLLNDFAAANEKAFKKDTPKNKDGIAVAVMQLKASGGMFKYQLISDIADICLNFVEGVEGFNEDAYRVVKAHQNSLNIILQNKLTGSGGAEGTALIKELHSACNRYHAKHPPEE